MEQELIFNNTVDLTFMIGVEEGKYRFLAVNNAFLDAARLTKEQVEGKYVEEVIPTSIYPGILAKYDQAIRERQTIQWEDNSEYPDGRRTGMINVTPVFNEQGVCTILVGIVHDITQRKKTEEKLRSREKQLDLIYNTVGDVIFLLSVEPGPRYCFTSVNKTFLVSTGLTREQVEGKYVDEIIPSPSLEIVLENYRKAIENRAETKWEETSQYPTGRRTGIVTVNPVFNDAGECTMLVGAVHDITNQKMIQDENERVNYSLKERVKELSTLNRASQLLHRENASNKELLEEMVNILPQGWQFPDITAGRIVIGNEEYKTANYADSLYCQSADFPVSEEVTGSIEIIYLEKRADDAEGPFLAEERNLINMLAEMLGLYFARKRSAEQLLKQKELSESIINSLPGIFYLFDNTGQYLLWNKNHETVPGYSTEEMRTMYPLNFFDDDEKQEIKEKIEKVFTEGYAEVEANFMAKDGKKIPYYFNGIAITYHDKPCLMGVGIDITAQKKMEKGLREAEIKFRTLVEKSQVGVYIVQQGKFVYVNPRFAEIFGYDADELVGADPVKTIISEEYQAISSENVRARMKGEVETVHYEANGKKKDGSINRIEFYGSRAFYGGEPTIIGTMVDITERKLAEEALQASQANLHTILETTDTIYALLDTNFHLMTFNHQAANFIKTEFDLELKINTSFVGYFPEDRRKIIHQKMTRVLSGESVNYESSYIQPDGSMHWYYVRMFPINNNASIFGLMIAVSDITEKKLLEQAIMDQKVQEQKKMTRAVLNAQEKERNNIGQELHDNVNQILVGAKMYLGYVKDRNPEDVESIQQSINLVDNAINEIRSLTREQVTPQRKIDLQDLIQSLVKNMNEHSSIQTHFIYDIGDHKIKDDLKINIYRIIQEGMNNILKHAAAKKVSLVVKADDQGLHVEIIDDGKGFSTSVAGTRGIGITNILNRVESYNGRIFIESKPGPGCRIDITVPL